MIYIFSIVILLIIISFFYKIRLKVVKKEEANIDLIISKFLNLRIDIDELAKKYFAFDKFGTTFQDIIMGFRLVFDNRNVINQYMKYAKITKITVIPRWNVSDPVWNTYLIFMNWQLNSLIKAYIDSRFKSQLDQYYQVIIKNEGDAKGITFEFEIEIRLLTFILLSIKNGVSLSKMLKFNKKKEGKSERTSNQ